MSTALAHSPPNDAIVTALLGLGYEVDLYAPGGDIPTDRYGARVRAYPVEYGNKWIVKNALSSRWRRYSLFSGTSEDPMPLVGILSWRQQSEYIDAPGKYKTLVAALESQWVVNNKELFL